MGNANVRSECGNGGMLWEIVFVGALLGMNVRSECGNVRSECFDRCKYMKISIIKFMYDCRRKIFSLLRSWEC